MLAMTYVLRNENGEITAACACGKIAEGWQQIEANNPDYIAFLEKELTLQSKFRESDIQLARVLEDLINVLIERNLIQFTDFPSAAQKRLNDRQSMRSKNHLHMLMDDYGYLGM